jgi:hypothetical protein
MNKKKYQRLNPRLVLTVHTTELTELHSGHSSVSVQAVYDFITFKKLVRINV